MGIVMAAGALVCGCVEREITFTSEPEGALVIVSDKEIGRTPVTLSFTWYGDYDIIYRLQGYQTIKTYAKINPPWYEYPPFDLLSHMAPWTYYDRRHLHHRMAKLKDPSDEELIRRAVILERRNRESMRR